MAIFHLNAKVLSRGKGQSAIAAAAYRSGERLKDEQANEQKYYVAREQRIVFTDIMAPKDAPEWAHDRNQLWNQAERAERRKDAQLAREIEVSLPHELTEKQREWLVKDFAREAFVRQGYAVDIAIHAPDKTSDERNHHAHLMITMRTLGPDGFAEKKDRSINTPEQLGVWREQWANLANRHLERHGHDARIDHRSLQARGIDQEPTVHLGYAANEMAQRGAQSDRMDTLRAVFDRNEIRTDIKALDRELKQLEAAAAKERAAAASPVPKSRATEKQNAEQESWRARRDAEVDRVEKAATPPPAKGGLRVVNAATGVVSKLADFMVDLLAGGSPTPERSTDMGAFVSDPAARKEQQLARLAERQQARADEKALESMADDMKAGRALSSADIQNLTRAHQETIRHFGDDAVRQMVEEAQKNAERHWKGNERERD